MNYALHLLPCGCLMKDDGGFGGVDGSILHRKFDRASIKEDAVYGGCGHKRKDDI